jgi:hypothetical protein
MKRTLEWKVGLYLSEEDGTTNARAVLDTGSSTLTGQGTARCSAEDADIPEIGDELAASRALKDLAGHLMRVADRDMERVGAGAEAPLGPPYSWTVGA